MKISGRYHSIDICFFQVFLWGGIYVEGNPDMGMMLIAVFGRVFKNICIRICALMKIFGRYHPNMFVECNLCKGKPRYRMISG